MRFPGQYADQKSGLFYNWHRYYDPSNGRFISYDPVGLAGGSFSGYDYVNDNPVSYVDPNGLQGCIPVVVPPGVVTCVPAPTGAAGAGGNSIEDSKKLAEQITRSLQKDGESKKKTYQTYTRYNPATGKCYSGRTAGYEDPQTNIGLRAMNQPHLNAEGFLPPVLDRSSENYSAVRGREQQLIEVNGGAQSSGGTFRNMINGISPYNPRRPLYLNDALTEFGVPIPAGNCTCQQ